MDFELKSLTTLKYAQLQVLCKKNGIRANQKKIKLIEQLMKLHDENAMKKNETMQDQKDIENDHGNENQRASENETVVNDKLPREELATEKEKQSESTTVEPSKMRKEKHENSPVKQEGPEPSKKDRVEPGVPEKSTVEKEEIAKKPTITTTEPNHTKSVGVPSDRSIEKERPVDSDTVHEASLNKDPTIWEREELKMKGKENTSSEQSNAKKKVSSFKPYTGPLPPFNGDSLFSPKKSAMKASTKRPIHRTFVKAPKDGHEERMNRYILSNKKTSEEVRNERRGL